MAHIIDIDDIKRINHDGGFHWFDPSSLRFFDSRYAQSAYLNDEKTRAYFVSSEQFHGSDGYPGPRLYTVRVVDMETGRFGHDVGGFQGYKTRARANTAARKAAEQNIPLYPES